MSIPLASLKDALSAPFPLDAIQFLPKSVRESNGHTVCTGFPYANKRVYEDRLNAIAFGEWTTPFVAPSLAGNRLIVPVTVVICGVAHTDYGEAFLALPGKGGTTRDDDNTATEAYSQGFRRACSHFGLGRYLYDLQKVTLPFNPQTRQIALSEQERLVWVERLYKAQHILPTVHAMGPSATSVQEQPPQSPMQEPTLSSSPSPEAQPSAPATAGPITKETGPEGQPAKLAQSPKQPVAYPQDIFLDWVASQVARDATRIQGICDNYRVSELSQLTENQRLSLTERLQRQVAKAGEAAVHVSSSSSSLHPMQLQSSRR